jgi:curved DNA-binding protein
MGNPKWLTADLLDTSQGGVGISLLTALTAGSKVVVRGKIGDHPNGSAIPATVKWCTEKINGNFHAGIELNENGSGQSGEDTLPAQESGEMDCYELMQLSPNADQDTIGRVYRILAQRYHPDSPGTGNKEIFIKLCEAHQILSDPQKRAKYDARYRETKQIHWKIFDRADAAKGPEAEQRKRQGILEMLYTKTVHDPERASMSIIEFEQMLGCPREHLETALWYLKGKGYVKRADNGRFTITVLGFDEVESHGGTPTEQPHLKLIESANEAAS